MKITYRIIQFLLIFCISSFCANANAATYYVRVDGGTPTQCNGTVNASYPGSGSAQPCAYNHPAWVIGAAGTAARWSGGDTLIIDDTNHANGQQAQYLIGYGMPNTITAHCALWWSYNCTMSSIPSGPDASHPTRILGIGYDSDCTKKPQLWGTDGVNQIFDLSGASNVEIQCLEITDHSNCGFRVGTPTCQESWNSGSLSGPWAKKGIYAHTGSNLTFTDLDIHGFADRGLLMGGLDDFTMSYVNMDGNYMSNWDSDVGHNNNESYNSGNIILDHVKNRFSGCSEIYPRSSSFNPSDYSNCTDQNDNPPGYGDGYGGYNTGGNWIITDSEFSHNTQDGLDLLYHDGTGFVSIQRSLFEGNDGNQIKITSSNINVENSIIIGNCSYLLNNGKVKNTNTWTSCRAAGDAAVYSVGQGGTYKMINSAVYSEGSSNLLFVDRMGTCNGSESYSFRNNINIGNGRSSLYINQLTGNCLTPILDTDYSIIFNVSNGFCPSGSHNRCSTNPGLVSPINLSAYTNVTNIALQSSSPAIGNATILSGISTLDFNSRNRGNNSWDIGPLEFAASETGTSTGTGTSTSTSTAVNTNTEQNTGTATETGTNTGTITGSSTSTSTGIGTGTATSTRTATGTGTGTNTGSGTNTTTGAGVGTDTNSSTNTNTGVDTSTISGTGTDTSTGTGTGTATGTSGSTIYYVRLDGGTSTQCTGIINAPYPGAGSSQACAFNHPVWALGAPGTTGALRGGDTLIINDTDSSNGNQAQYKIGYGMPNTISANCAPWFSYDCIMSAVPSGPDAGHPTRILGSSYNSGCNRKPQLWGAEGVNQIFNLSGKANINLECLEITDHSNCGFRVGSPLCAERWNIGQSSGNWAKKGIYARTGRNFVFSNLDVHGLANRGFLMGGITGLTFSYVNMDGNYQSNWDSDVGHNGVESYMSGSIVLDHVKNRFAGCSEAYPRSSSFNVSDYSGCTDQNDNPPGYGDGYGGYDTGGNWIITNSEFSHNTQDGLDLIYHDGTGSVNIQRSLFEGNNGNQIKITSPRINVENSIVIGNCNYLMTNNKVKNRRSFTSCRAGGDAIVFSVGRSGIYKIVNSTIYSDGNSQVLFVNRLGTCNGTETYNFRNNINIGNGRSLYLKQLAGSCNAPALDTDYSIINNVSGSFCPNGSHNLCNTSPGWIGSISQTAESNVNNVNLNTSSPAVGAGLLISGASSLDYNHRDRGTSWDIGALEH